MGFTERLCLALAQADDQLFAKLTDRPGVGRGVDRLAADVGFLEILKNQVPHFPCMHVGIALRIVERGAFQAFHVDVPTISGSRRLGKGEPRVRQG